MSLYYIVIIMAATGIFGGIVNFYSDANAQREAESTTIIKLRPIGVCILFGLAATVLVPLFLKFADSKLLQEIHIPVKVPPTETKPSGKPVPKAANYSLVKNDSIQTTPSNNNTGAQPVSTKPDGGKKTEEKEKSVATDYMIWTAYCLLAACAGMRFIDLLMSKIITKETMNQKNNEIQELSKEIKGKEKELTTSLNNYKVSESIQLKDAVESKSFTEIGTSALDQSALLISWLPPITHSNDPQKGRFGGKSRVNGKSLTADYDHSNLPGVLNLIIKVSSVEGDLNSDVYLFLHNSFAKSIIHLEGNGKKVVEYKIPAYGAFTIGAITDNGNTHLELDLEKLENFPEDFRNR
ncbi:YEATS-associated helix-containing protein [Chryseobacterium sp. OSA05B]|uniref:YEATS-associated helix-containing protein n=1 Tax=Chryseobacterium sp. OSA05B TaxID=2862650 RepID=UPI001CBADC88|nr:YEATS-associated helix-containing protein [Chryseobacterium sp. OSA05B]